MQNVVLKIPIVTYRIITVNELNRILKSSNLENLRALKSWWGEGGVYEAPLRAREQRGAKRLGL